MDVASEIIGWLVIAAISAWLAWSGGVRPLLVPETEIAGVADRLAARYGPRAEEMAAIEEDRAWRYSDSFEQGKWRRVRRTLRRRALGSG